jgi:hypothetical protein
VEVPGKFGENREGLENTGEDWKKNVISLSNHLQNLNLSFLQSLGTFRSTRIPNPKNNETATQA